jgi:hypothetical protein
MYLVEWTVVCMLICTFISGGMDGCILVNMHISIMWYGRLYVCLHVHWYLVGRTVVCMLICTLVSDGKDGCLYVNMYIGTKCIWWYGRLYVC